VSSKLSQNISLEYVKIFDVQSSKINMIDAYHMRKNRTAYSTS